MQRWMQAMVPEDFLDDSMAAKASAGPSRAPAGRPLQSSGAAGAKLQGAAAAAATAAFGKGPMVQQASSGNGQGGMKDFFVPLPGKDVMGNDAFMMRLTSIEEAKRACRSRGCTMLVVSGGMVFLKNAPLSPETFGAITDKPGALMYIDVGKHWLGTWHRPQGLWPEFRITEDAGSLGLRMEVPIHPDVAYYVRATGLDEAESVSTDGWGVKFKLYQERVISRHIRPPGQTDWINEEFFTLSEDFSGTWAGPGGLVIVEQMANCAAKILFFGPDGGLAEVYAASVKGRTLEFEGPRAKVCYGVMDQLRQTILWPGNAGELPLVGQVWGRVEAGFRAYAGNEPRLPAQHAMQMQAGDLAACKRTCVERGYGGFSVADGQALLRGEPAADVLASLQPSDPWRTSFVRLSDGEEAMLQEAWRSALEMREEVGRALEVERRAWDCKFDAWIQDTGPPEVLDAKANRRVLRDVEASWTGVPAASFHVSLLDPVGADAKRLAVRFVEALQRIYLALLPIFSGTDQAEPVRAFWQTTCLCVDLLSSFACLYFRNQAAGLFQSAVDLLLEVLHVTRWANVDTLLAGDAASMAQGALRSVVVRLVACLREAWEQRLAAGEGDEEEEKAAEERLEFLAAHVQQQGQPPPSPPAEELQFWKFGRGRGTRLLLELCAGAAKDPDSLFRLHLFANSSPELGGWHLRAVLVAGRRGIFACFYDVLEQYGFEPGIEGVRDLARHYDRWAKGDATVQHVAGRLAAAVGGSVPPTPSAEDPAAAAAAAGGAPAAAGDAPEGELQGKFTLDGNDYTANIKDFGRYRVFVQASAPKDAGFHVFLCTHSEVGHMTPTFRIARSLVARSAIGRVTFATNMFGARKVVKWLREQPDTTGKLQLIGYEDGWNQEMQDTSNTMAQAGDGTLVMTVASYAEYGMMPLLESMAEEPGGREANEPAVWVLDIMAIMGAWKAVTHNFASKKPVLVSCPLPIIATPMLEMLPAKVLCHCFTLPKDVGDRFSSIGIPAPGANVLPVGVFAGDPGKDLPEELLAFVERPGPPVVYVSMGSQGAFTKEQLLAVSEGLTAPGEWRVLWSLRDSQQKDLPGGGPEGLGADFLVKSWLPQADLLRHPRIAAFVSHCGWGATSEAILSATPVVAVPLFADQPLNAGMMDMTGMARMVCSEKDARKEPEELFAAVCSPETDSFFDYIKTLRAEDVRRAVRDVLTDKRYKEAADAALLHASLSGDGAARSALEIERCCLQPGASPAA